MKKTKIMLTTAIASVAVLCSVLGGMKLAEKSNVFKTVADSKPYTLVYDKDHKVVDAVIKTDNGNDIWTKANYNCSFTDNGLEFTKYGYVQNLTPLQGIKSVKLEVTSGKYIVSHGYLEPNDLNVPEYYDAKVTETTTVDMSEVAPSYFRVQALEEGTLKSITVEYNCTGTAEDSKLETVNEGLENTKFANTYNFGLTSYVTDTLCQSEFAVSKRAIKILEPTKNEDIRIVNMDAARKAGYSCTDDSYLIMDIKSSNAKVGSTVNPFMMNSNVSDFGWKDPSGYIALPDNPGWYRYYFKMELSGAKIKLSDVQWIGVIFTQNVDAGEEWYFDNIHFGDKPTRIDALGSNYDMLADDRFTINQDSLFYFDFKHTGESGKKAYFQIGNWTNVYCFELNNDGKRIDGGGDNKGLYNGTTLIPLCNGWYRIYVTAKDMNRVNSSWNKWEFGTNDEIKLVLTNKYNESTGYVSEPKLCSGMTFSSAPSMKVTNIANLSITSDMPRYYMDVKLISNLSDSISFMLSSDGTNGFGYFEFCADGSKKWGGSYDGVVVVNLENNVFRLIFDFNKITKIKNNKPTSLTRLDTNGWGKSAFVFSKLNVLEDYLEDDSVSVDVYQDVLDHIGQPNYGIHKVTTGTTCVRETSVVATAGGKSWKVSSLVTEDVWEWVLFDLGQNFDINNITNLKIKSIGAQKWVMVRLFNEDKYPISDSASFDFTTDDFFSTGVMPGKALGARYIGVCLHFIPNIQATVYIDDLELDLSTFNLTAGKNAVFGFNPIACNSGKKIEMTFKNITKVDDDIGFYLIDNINNARNFEEGTTPAFGKLCVEPDHTLYQWGSKPEYTQGVTATVEDNTNKICTIVLDLGNMVAGRSGCPVPTSVSAIYFAKGIMSANAAEFSFRIIDAD